MGRARWNDTTVPAHPGRPSDALVWLARRVLWPVVRLAHRPTLEGVEHLPAAGPFLLVANHSAGLGASEIAALLCLYLEKVGPGRPLAAFAHPAMFRVFPLSGVLRHLGAVPSNYASAAAVLAAGVPLLVFPGGDHETLRPVWQAGRVDFGGRVGFLRIARGQGVPVVPLGIRGSHYTAPVVGRSRALATLLVQPRLLGTKRWAISALGVIVAAAIVALAPWAPWVRALAVWAWLGSPLVFLPWVPWTIRMRIGPPLDAAELFAGDATDDGLRRALTRVESAVQRLVD